MKVKFKDLLNVLDARAYIEVYDAETKKLVLYGHVWEHLGTFLNGDIEDMQVFMSTIRLVVR